MNNHDDRMQWPFFDESHRRLATEASRWASASLDTGAHPTEHRNVLGQDQHPDRQHP